jgi:uncharacterized protein involved in outer membrane biogenesis
MGTSPGLRKWLDWAHRALFALGAVLAILLTALWLLSSHLRAQLIGYAERNYQRPIRVAGRFEAHLFSLHPRLVAEGVTIGNPSWSPTGSLAEIGHLELTYDLPWLWRWPALRRIEMRQARLSLFRDEAGRANWAVGSPDAGPGPGPPRVHGLAMPDARVRLEDRRLHLLFDGAVSALEVPSPRSPDPALRISGAGQLNGREARLVLDGEPLRRVSSGQPYRFEFVESSSGSQLHLRGVVPEPFDFQQLEASFDAAGEDLKDLYFLTGVTLLDTGRYRLSGQFVRQGGAFQFKDLQVISGRSDVQGRVTIAASQSGSSHVEVQLTSKRLRVADLGLRAAGRAAGGAEAADKGQGHLLSDTPFQLTGARGKDAVVRFRAQTLEAGHVTFQTVAAEGRVLDGVISLMPVSAAMGDGKIKGEARIDVTQDTPEASLDLHATNVRLDQLMSPKAATPEDPAGRPPLLDGPLQARVRLRGKGHSLHALAAKADGKVTVVLPQGELRASVAELAGLDLRALGLKLAGDSAATQIRCGVASFDAKDGLLTAQRLVLDTEPVVITGEGNIDLEHEALDLRLQAHPKHPRLRVRSPALVHGNLRHPAFSADLKKPVAQAGGAIALGVLLSPVAAMLAFVDPGLANDTNCAALLTQAGSDSK